MIKLKKKSLMSICARSNLINHFRGVDVQKETFRRREIFCKRPRAVNTCPGEIIADKLSEDRDFFKDKLNKQTDISVLYACQFMAEKTLQIFLSKFQFRTIEEEKPMDCVQSDKLMVKFGIQLGSAHARILIHLIDS